MLDVCCSSRCAWGSDDNLGGLGPAFFAVVRETVAAGDLEQLLWY